MLEELLIFTRGGLILWSSCRALGAAALKGSPIDALIRSCLLEERSADASFSQDNYALKWTFHNDLGLVFVAVYQKILHLLYVDDLLAAVRREFSQIYDPKRTSYDDFGDIFRQLHREAEARAEEMKKSKQALSSRPQPALSQKKVGPKGRRGDSHGAAANKGGSGAKDDSDGDDSGNKDQNTLVNGAFKGQENGVRKENSLARPVVVKGKENGGPKDNGAFDVSKLQKLRTNKKNVAADNGTKKLTKPDTKKKGKQDRVWDDKPSNKKLDFTDPADERGDEVTDNVAVIEGESMMDKDEDLSSDSEDEEVEDGPKKKGWFSSMFQSIAGNNVLEKSDLQPALKALKDRLMAKNVAEEIAEKLCESVAASLEGKKLGSFTRISSTVQTAMEDALLRILTPRRSIDILRDVHAAKERGRPYVIVFVGVNGVGKSTNLAKVAYWLLQHNLSVTLAACDTFRSGAVEQLRTHARRLQIPIFEKGYEKDPAVVAREAIQEATRNKSDVVLVDTAGRMQVG